MMTRDDKILNLYVNGVSKSEICRQLELNYGYVRGEIRRSGLEPKKELVPQYKIDRIKCLIQFNNGTSTDYTHNEIAEEVDLTIPEVSEAIRMIEYEKRRGR
jgi:hypothetical protein